MNMKIDIREFPARWEEALALVSSGVEIILMDGLTARARLLPWGAMPSRVEGLHAGAMQPSEDFDAPLPDDFWTGQT
jgi:antitoxin (DNA-binding transcriptional repressor) of toxin-antitoxin stability system